MSVSTIWVNLGQRSYPIYIGRGLLRRLGSYLRARGLGGKFIIFSHPEVLELYGETIRSSLTRKNVVEVSVPSGEKSKGLKTIEKVYEALAEAKATKEATLIALGGGVVGDLAGFVAATYMRGINLVNVPTTLLSQVDSSIGGKAALNLKTIKNLIGVFYQPKLVLIDIDTLATLPEIELHSGMAEVVKYGAALDLAFFKWMEEKWVDVLNLEKTTLLKTIKMCCLIKARIVEEDERDEKGIRALLNFGHTIGHAIEILAQDGITHGQAVSIGMVCEAEISRNMGILRNSDFERLHNLLSSIGLPVRVPKVDVEGVIERISFDKKNLGGKSRFILLKSIGRAFLSSNVPQSIVKEVLRRRAG
ncbi:MAG TPA: 3-dehydroquinate synthase [Candidatus Korarchaeota archaeon]|nr:3-dehydroquinate synthase [Candidatus Korarchaeota archaeon]